MRMRQIIKNFKITSFIISCDENYPILVKINLGLIRLRVESSPIHRVMFFLDTAYNTEAVDYGLVLCLAV